MSDNHYTLFIFLSSLMHVLTICHWWLMIPLIIQFLLKWCFSFMQSWQIGIIH